MQIIPKNKSINKVTMSNILIQSKITMSLDAQKLIFIGISKLKEKEDMFNTDIFISAKEFMELTDTTDKTVYKRIDKATDELIRTIIVEREGKYFKKSVWVTHCEYKNYDGLQGVKFRINDMLKPYVIDLKNNFTNLNLHSLVSFKSKYAIRLYSILKSECWKSTSEFSIVNLKFYLGLEDKQYPDFYQFNRAVLHVAINEINNNSELNIKYTPVKTNKQVTSLIFSISTKNISAPEGAEICKSQQKKYVASEEYTDFNKKVNLDDAMEIPFTMLSPCTIELQSLGFEEQKIKKLIDDHTEGYLSFLINNILKLKDANNPAGYLLSIVNNKEYKNKYLENTEKESIDSRLEKEKQEYEEQKKQEEQEFNQNGESFKREFFMNYPEVFIKYVYAGINRSYCLTSSGYPTHPEWSHKPEEKELQIKIANNIYEKFSKCSSIRDFTNLVKGDESWVFKGFVTFEEYKKGNDKHTMESLKNVKVPFDLSIANESKNNKNLPTIDIDIANLAEKFKVL